MDESTSRKGLARAKLGTNPSRATRQTHPDSKTHPSQNTQFDRSKTGVFVTGFDAREYERATTILNPNKVVCCSPNPDIGIFEGEKESKQESTPVCSRSKVELGSTGGSP